MTSPSPYIGGNGSAGRKSLAMTEREALQILFDCASRVSRGVGTGISLGVPDEGERAKIAKAVERLWRKVNNWPMSSNDRFNMGLGA